MGVGFVGIHIGIIFVYDESRYKYLEAESCSHFLSAVLVPGLYTLKQAGAGPRGGRGLKCRPAATSIKLQV